MPVYECQEDGAALPVSGVQGLLVRTTVSPLLTTHPTRGSIQGSSVQYNNPWCDVLETPVRWQAARPRRPRQVVLCTHVQHASAAGDSFYQC